MKTADQDLLVYERNMPGQWQSVPTNEYGYKCNPKRCMLNKHESPASQIAVLLIENLKYTNMPEAKVFGCRVDNQFFLPAMDLGQVAHPTRGSNHYPKLWDTAMLQGRGSCRSEVCCVSMLEEICTSPTDSTFRCCSHQSVH